MNVEDRAQADTRAHDFRIGANRFILDEIY